MGYEMKSKFIKKCRFDEKTAFLIHQNNFSYLMS
jgi:hypothetical protein